MSRDDAGGSSGHSSQRRVKRKIKSPQKPPEAKKSCSQYTCRSLLDLCAEVVAVSIPFQTVEDRFSPVPEAVQLRIIYWSFPRNEDEIRMYSSISSIGANNDTMKYTSAFSTSVENSSGPKQQFNRAVRLLNEGNVREALQIGFHLSGNINCPNTKPSASDFDFLNDEKQYKVSINFDRCKITSVSCTCDNKDIFWCPHVVALALFRIRCPNEVKYRLPISESLCQMTKDQLQKLCMYTIAAHHRDILPTCQQIVDSLLSPSSKISVLAGYPDPTAGACKDDENCYFIDESQVQEQVRFYLSQGGYYNSAKQLKCMFSKIKEMLKARDTNGPRMLKLITLEFMADPKLKIWHTQGSAMTEKSRILWDTLGYMWLMVVFNPLCPTALRNDWKGSLLEWHSKPECPLENPDLPNLDSLAEDKRTVFSRALDTYSFSWDESPLQSLLRKQRRASSSGNSAGKSTDLRYWDEDIAIATCRVDTLRCNGFENESLVLALAVIRSLRRRLRKKVNKSRRSDEPILDSAESWVGNPSEPILALVDLLLEVSEDSSASPAKFVHIPIPDGLSPRSATEEDSYLCLAFEVAILGLSQHRLLPAGLYAQERLCRAEEMIISKLSNVNMDSRIVRTLVTVSKALMKGFNNGLALQVHAESVPMQILCKYLFEMLVHVERELAFDIGVLGLRLPVTDNNQSTDDTESLMFNAENTRWYTLGNFQSRQVELALAMFIGANDNMPFIKKVLDAVQCHLKSASHLFSLAQDIHKKATSGTIESDCKKTLLNVAFELGLQLLRITLRAATWRRSEMVAWQIKCAMDVGAGALISMMQSWSNFLTPKEATNNLSSTVMNRDTPMRLQLNFTQIQELKNCTRTLVLQCTRKDPANCAVYALTFCENDRQAFEAAYSIILEASPNTLPANQLFTIARFLEQRMHRYRAFKLSNLALKRLKIGASQETHQSVNDVHWAVAISFQLGRTEIVTTLRQVISSVQCANVLSDILRRCTMSAPNVLESSKRSGSKSPGGGSSSRFLAINQSPLNELLEATLNAYLSGITSRLQHISPRHYTDFLTLLHKARHTFNLAPNGRQRFAQLMENLMTSHKGKKKLMQLIRQTFPTFAIDGPTTSRV
ncbi:zinc finger SWIM domain-containing protein 5-like [Convolutriloba macropyga]|uniref:zinc finger SWIM domain-containing protein 5-like n=1 Tax=Convolutriloba macropyga TaxID=536237 RepID=UPI003F527732